MTNRKTDLDFHADFDISHYYSLPETSNNEGIEVWRRTITQSVEKRSVKCWRWPTGLCWKWRTKRERRQFLTLGCEALTKLSLFYRWNVQTVHGVEFVSNILCSYIIALLLNIKFHPHEAMGMIQPQTIKNLAIMPHKHCMIPKTKNSQIHSPFSLQWAYHAWLSFNLKDIRLWRLYCT